MLKTSTKSILAEIVNIFIHNIFNNILKTKISSYNNFVNFENIISIYANNKKILLNKSDNFFKFLDNSISNVKFEISFENKDYLQQKDYLKQLIKKFEKLNLNNYVNFLNNDIRLKFIEKFKQLINNITLLYVFFTSISLNYNSINSDTKIGRSPPLLS